MLRAKSVMADGPPIVCSSRLPAALSLTCTAAAQRSASVIWPPEFGAVLGEFGSAAQLGVDENLPVQRQLAVLHHLQHPRGGVALERRTHRERLAIEVRHRAAGLQVNRVHADLDVVPLLQRLDAVVDRRHRFGGIGKDSFLSARGEAGHSQSAHQHASSGQSDSPLPR